MISWEKELGKKCFDLNIEPVLESNRIIFYCSKMPDKKSDITTIIPNEYTYEFIETIKPTTSKVIMVNSSIVGLMGNIKTEKRKVFMEFKTMSPDTEIKEEIWNLFSMFIKEDGYADEWEITINDHTKIYNMRIARIIEENRFRDTFINEEDIMNLRISLNSCKSIDELLKYINNK